MTDQIEGTWCCNILCGVVAAFEHDKGVKFTQALGRMFVNLVDCNMIDVVLVYEDKRYEHTIFWQDWKDTLRTHLIPTLWDWLDGIVHDAEQRRLAALPNPTARDLMRMDAELRDERVAASFASFEQSGEEWEEI